jgi:peptide-methionine (S)-S-oxide reductase
MKSYARTAITLLLLLVGPVSAEAKTKPAPVAHSETAVLAGGCFWGMEAVFERLKGVQNVVSGFTGGSSATAHYELVSTGTTGHAESVKINFDPTRISYRTLLTIYFRIAHDPTELNYQGPDHGSQYRSSIFYTNDAQRRVAQSMIAALSAKHVFHSPIVTTVVPLTSFYTAERYHQHFYDNNPTQAYIVEEDKPKVAALEAQYPQLLTKQR